MSTSGDEDLERAIALSLCKSDPTPTSNLAVTSANDAIDLDDDSESNDRASRNEDVQPDGNHTQDSINNSGMLGMDRKKMEEERLARKRRRSTSPPSVRKVLKQKTSDPSNELHLTGVVKKTWVSGHERAGHDIKLEEILQPKDLQIAVLSSFQWDIPWLLNKINLERTKTTLVMQAKDQGTRAQYLQETSQMCNLRLCFPPMEGQIFCMHSKLMLLSHPTYLRIVVPTANLVRYDWGETGEMENMVFLIDLPRFPGGRRSTREVRIWS